MLPITSKLVDDYLAQRASGRSSSVGDHLNYANPNYSSSSNMKWISTLDGPRLGYGSSIHWHGTTSDNQKYRPGAFNIGLPGSPVSPKPVSDKRRPLS